MLTKTIVVHLEHSDLGRARLATAIELASRHHAHLTGLYISLEDFDGDLYGRSRGRGLSGARQDRLAQDSADARAGFEELAAQRALRLSGLLLKSAKTSMTSKPTPVRLTC